MRFSLRRWSFCFTIRSYRSSSTSMVINRYPQDRHSRLRRLASSCIRLSHILVLEQHFGQVIHTSIHIRGRSARLCMPAEWQSHCKRQHPPLPWNFCKLRSAPRLWCIARLGENAFSLHGHACDCSMSKSNKNRNDLCICAGERECAFCRISDKLLQSWLITSR